MKAPSVTGYAMSSEANSVNESIWLDQNLYSRLLQPNATGTALLPDLATSWDISANGLSCHIGSQILDPKPIFEAIDIFYFMNWRTRRSTNSSVESPGFLNSI